MIKFAKLRKQYLVSGKCFVSVNVIVLISAFSYMLDVARGNAKRVSYINKGLTPAEAKENESFPEGWELAMTLIKSHMAHRLNNAPNLTECLRKSMMYFLGRKVAVHPQVDSQPQQSLKLRHMCG